MRHDLSAIPEAPRARESGSRLLTRLYHDIGLAAVAGALEIQPTELEPEEREAVDRGAFYIVPEFASLAS